MGIFDFLRRKPKTLEEVNTEILRIEIQLIDLETKKGTITDLISFEPSSKQPIKTSFRPIAGSPAINLNLARYSRRPTADLRKLEKDELVLESQL